MIRKKLSLFSRATALATSLHLSHSMSFVKAMKEKQSHSQQYDIAVIGGGSGGLAAAFQANKHGLKVVVIDYVDPSPQGTKWGLGGTCVNVGCIPKKLMHISAGFPQAIMNANNYGWQLPHQINARQNEKQIYKYFNWDKLRQGIVNYIKSLNFGYIKTIRGLEGVNYKNMMATFIDKNTLLCSKDPQIIYNYLKNGTIPQIEQKKHEIINAKNFIIATGTRPTYLPIQGHKLAITSDDVFFMKNPPGKTLIVGGGYIAVQMAGIIKSLGFPVSMMTRGDYLRSFDRDMVEQILNDLKKRQIQIIPTSLPTKLQQLQNSTKIKATYKCQKNGNQYFDVFDTVLFATGRHATTDILGLDKVGIKTDKNKQIITLQKEKQLTHTDNIYAIGDVVKDAPQLTGTVTKVGYSLARRIAQKLNKKTFPKHQLQMSLDSFPTTIFTPLQFSTCGLSQQAANNKYKAQNVQVYHLKFTPLQEQIVEKYNDLGQSLKNMAYMKVVVHIQEDKRQKVVGIHYVGPHAGQILQGFYAAFYLGIYKDQLDKTIGIHPTLAQNFTDLHITKSSQQDFIKTSC